MTVLVPKRSTETVLYTLNLQGVLGEDTIATYTLVLNSGTVTIGETQNAGVAVLAPISGGTDGEDNALTLTINTFAEQVLVKNYSLLVSDAVSAVIPSTTTKRFILKRHFEAMGLSPYEFDPTPEEYLSALDSLDMMMAEWVYADLDCGYAFPPTLGGGDLDDVSGVPDFAVNGIAMSLAERMAPLIGKSLTAEAKSSLGRAMIALRARLAIIPDRVLPFMTLRGAGNKPLSSWYPFIGSNGNGPSQ